MFDGAILFYLDRLLIPAFRSHDFCPSLPPLTYGLILLTSLSFSILLGSLQVLASS